MNFKEYLKETTINEEWNANSFNKNAEELWQNTMDYVFTKAAGVKAKKMIQELKKKYLGRIDHFEADGSGNRYSYLLIHLKNGYVGTFYPNEPGKKISFGRSSYSIAQMKDIVRNKKTVEETNAEVIKFSAEHGLEISENEMAKGFWIMRTDDFNITVDHNYAGTKDFPMWKVIDINHTRSDKEFTSAEEVSEYLSNEYLI